MDRKIAHLLRDVRPFVTDEHLLELIDEELTEYHKERNGMTKRQAEVYEFIGRYIAAEGRSPSHLDIATNFRWQSLNSSLTHVHELERKGWLTTEGGWRNVRLTEKRP